MSEFENTSIPAPSPRNNSLINRVASYAVMSVLVVASYGLIVSGVSLLTVHRIAPDNPWLMGVLVFILALVFNPLHHWVQKRVDDVFYRHESIYQEALNKYNQDLANASDQPVIVTTLRQSIEQLLAPTISHIFIFEPQSDYYLAAAGEHEQLTSDIHFTLDSPLVTALDRRKTPLFINQAGHFPAEIEKEKARLLLLASQVYIPIPGRDRLAGWIALGPRRSGASYTSQDTAFLKNLASQTAQALDRVQAIRDMETRVLEMNVMSRVAQGVNVTISLDDILELIYAQTNQVIPTRDFFLILSNLKTNTYQYAFFLENDDRITDRENKPFTGDQNLEQIIVQTHQSILIDDYQIECQKNGYAPLTSGLYAWMGVPLNAGAETIGALCTGSRDHNQVYTQEQLNLLQAISDQAAGAIVKARLLQESEQRARQLATLNEITRQVTSSLELEGVLQNMLQNSIEILNCEAGSLLLADEQTDELVFRVTAGPVADNLVGQRLPSSFGLVGRSFHAHEPVISNNVQSTTDWFSGTDQRTGFTTRALMVIPLQVKDRVIGVIEVLNKKDGLPFTQDDQNLLGAFASQAAVAIENARLYTLTDQALESRVEELSVMQRIDRELNTSLDISRAMTITLDWAMRQSNATAGMIGVCEDNGLRIMASQGYSTELAPYENAPLSLDFFPFLSTIQTGQPQQIAFTDDQDTGLSELPAEKPVLLAGTLNQVVIPIRRESSVIGIILLESVDPEPCSEESIAFLSRLSDHAAIAISNAQLYTAVQAANLAKSEFVSFVSHELKNPMTSIKGYTELLAAGAVGPVNDAQASFLSTIRSNVERMSTLVSDLADVSRIEAGRLRLDFKVMGIHEIVDEVVRSTRRQIEEKEQALNLMLPSDLRPVWADRMRLIQVLTNLISNAQKYTTHGGAISLGAEQCPNHWNPAGAPEVIHLWVQDNGIGISPEDQKKIFQKFFRSEDPKTREAPGTGLGLNITKSLVEMQGGQIWFDSSYRVGTTFHITIPVAQQG